MWKIVETLQSRATLGNLNGANKAIDMSTIQEEESVTN